LQTARLATEATKVAGSERLSESQHVMKPQRRSFAVDRVTTLQNGDVISGEPIHEDRPIGICERRVVGRSEQLHRYRTVLHECLKVPPIGPQ
jgi:hypothetical protein